MPRQATAARARVESCLVVPIVACLALVAVAALAASCHRGEVWSDGVSCDRDRPCRGPLTCVHGSCRQIVPDPARTCAPLARFGAPVLLPDIPHDARLSPDERTIYFGDWPEGSDYSTIFMATRSSPTGPFGAPVRAMSGSYNGDLYSPSVTADGLTLFLESSIGSNFFVYAATRNSLSERFGPIQRLDGIGPSGDPFGHGSPYILPDGDVLYFHSGLSGQVLDVARSVRGQDGSFGLAVEVGSINTGNWEGTPAVTPDERTLFFSSNRGDDSGRGQLDIWMTTRPSPEARFGAPVNVAELSTGFNEVPLWISPDGCRLYFLRDEGGIVKTYVVQKEVGDPGPVPGDAGAADSASAEPGACDLTRPFEMGVALPGLNGAARTETFVHLNQDELTAYFLRGAPSDVFRATRTARDQPFGQAVAVAELNGPSADHTLSVTRDGRTLFMESDRSGASRVLVATRAALGEPFSTPAPLPDVGGAGWSEADGGPFVLPDGDALYFHAVRSGQTRVYRAALDGEAAAPTPGPPVPVPLIDGAADVLVPVVSPDERVVFFASDHQGDAGPGDQDIWMASRPSRTGDFEAPTKAQVQELNTSDDDVPNWISPDGCRLYFHRRTTERSWLYVAARPARQ